MLILFYGSWCCSTFWMLYITFVVMVLFSLFSPVVLLIVLYRLQLFYWWFIIVLLRNCYNLCCICEVLLCCCCLLFVNHFAMHVHEKQCRNIIKQSNQSKQMLYHQATAWTMLPGLMRVGMSKISGGQQVLHLHRRKCPVEMPPYASEGWMTPQMGQEGQNLELDLQNRNRARKTVLVLSVQPLWLAPTQASLLSRPPHGFNMETCLLKQTPNGYLSPDFPHSSQSSAVHHSMLAVVFWFLSMVSGA